MKCRFCDKELKHTVIDLENAPPSNAFLSGNQLDDPEVFFPLRIFVCSSCFLVQVDEYKRSNEIFNAAYPYFSSYSNTWLAHARRYADMMAEKYRYGADSRIIEIASNDGYLLQYFSKRGIPVLGIEPAEGTAAAAREKGIETLTEFFNRECAHRLASGNMTADLLIGNNVLAHVPDINDFTAAMNTVLKENGVITMEFPHVMRLIDGNQFDTIYHEHFSYLSLFTVRKIFNRHGLEIFDVEELPTHGGSLRIFARHTGNGREEVSARVKELADRELAGGLAATEYYTEFQEKANQVKYDLLSFLIEKKNAGKTIGAYGAAAKGNTLFNYCGIKKDLIPFVADASPHKQGKYLPGSHIPVVHTDIIHQYRPAFVLILPWNLRDEITDQLGFIREWGGRFVTAIPGLEIF